MFWRIGLLIRVREMGLLDGLVGVMDIKCRLFKD